jgi:hypothetical protein
MTYMFLWRPDTKGIVANTQNRVNIKSLRRIRYGTEYGLRRFCFELRKRNVRT